MYGLTSADAPWSSVSWDLFEQHAGKRISLLHWGLPFGGLPQTPLEKTKARGATSLITLDFPIPEILSGAADTRIDAIIASARAFGGEILLRPGWEMNGGWYAWGRKPDYATAWRYVVGRIRAAGITNVRFVWCVNVIWDAASDPAPYWPGDNYVDYVGIDGYNWGTNPAKSGRWQSPSEVFQATVERCAVIAPTKQIIVCEVGCSEFGGDKAVWINQFLGTYVPSHPRIDGVVWFNDKAHAEGMDWPIETSSLAQTAFKGGIASPHYLAPA